MARAEVKEIRMPRAALRVHREKGDVNYLFVGARQDPTIWYTPFSSYLLDFKLLNPFSRIEEGRHLTGFRLWTSPELMSYESELFSFPEQGHEDWELRLKIFVWAMRSLSLKEKVADGYSITLWNSNLYSRINADHRGQRTESR